MKRVAIALATAVALFTAPAVMAKDKMTGEEKLAKLLEGREAGEPVQCLPYSASSDMKIIDKTAIVYGRGDTIWVNRPTNAETLDDDDILVRKSHTAQLCSVDIVQTMDQTSKMFTGTVALSQFVPYRKVAMAN